VTHPTEFFPPAERVIYEAAPLVQVICQLRYPSILKVEQTPADFQDRIRGRFPLFERAHGPSLDQLPAEIAQIIGAQTLNYLFLTEDRLTTLSLSPDAIALSTRAYSRWEEFRALLEVCLSAFTEIYRPAFYSRIGLRYINRIRPSRIGLDGVAWSALLSENIVGEFAVPELEPNILASTRTLRVSMAEAGGAFLLQHGLGPNPGSKNYSIDLDFYADAKTEVAHAQTILDDFNKLAGRGFRWCISERLHAALQPKPIRDSDHPGRV